jgi:hypothetical protein
LNIELKLTKIYLKIEKEISKLKINDIYKILGSENYAIRKDSDTTFSYLEKVNGQSYYNIFYTNLDIREVMDVTLEITPEFI